MYNVHVRQAFWKSLSLHQSNTTSKQISLAVHVTAQLYTGHQTEVLLISYPYLYYTTHLSPPPTLPLSLISTLLRFSLPPSSVLSDLPSSGSRQSTDRVGIPQLQDPHNGRRYMCTYMYMQKRTAREQDSGQLTLSKTFRGVSATEVAKRSQQADMSQHVLNVGDVGGVALLRMRIFDCDHAWIASHVIYSWFEKLILVSMFYSIH